MTVLNMWMFNLNADIYCGNSLSMEMYRLWRVRKGGFVYESEVDQMPQGVQAQVEQAVETPPVQAEAVQTAGEQPPRPIIEEPATEELGQQALFDMGEYKKKRVRKL